jgi:transposase InsO family protein
MYKWIEKNHGEWSISLCCAVLGVRREGYYNWRKKPAQDTRDEALISALKEVRKEHRHYGVRSLINALPEEIRPSYGKGYRLCKESGLLTKKRKPKCTTKADPEAQKSEDLVNRNFTAEKPGTKLFTDISEIGGCKDGKFYVCGIIDAFDSLVAISMADNVKTELCTAAVMEYSRRYGHEENCIMHGDRGSQFTSHLYREVLSNQGFRQSMGRTGCCYDNAKMESFWATLKKELIYNLPLSTMTKSELKHAIFEWVESYYNRSRRHTSNQNDMPPLVKRQSFSSTSQSTAA